MPVQYTTKVTNILIMQVSSCANRRRDKESICKIFAKPLHADFMIPAVRDTIDLWYCKTFKIQKTFYQCMIHDQITNCHIADKRGIIWAEYQIQYMAM